MIRDNIVTPEVRANGYGGIDRARFARAIDQLALTYKFNGEKPHPDDIFDDSYLPPAADRKVGSQIEAGRRACRARLVDGDQLARAGRGAFRVAAISSASCS